MGTGHRSIILTLLLFLVAPAARADFVFGDRVDLTKIIPAIDPLYDGVMGVSSDGLEMYVVSESRPGGLGACDIWVLKRASVNDAWGPLVNLGPTVNSAWPELGGCLSADGLTFYLTTFRPEGYGENDICVTTRATKNDPWGPLVNLGMPVNSSAHDACCGISADGRELYLGSTRSGGYGRWDIWVARRAATNSPWDEPVNLGPVVNSEYDEQASLSPEGLLLLLSETFEAPFRPGGQGGGDIWIARRASLSAPWQAPVNLGPKINSRVCDFGAAISHDGRTLYFSTVDMETWAFGSWQAPIIPIVDFNADKKLDLVDLVMLIDNWGTNNTLCDIGPMPWGDGKVDIEDLKVFMTYYEKENPPAQP
jgi:hypothetical protein